MKKMDFGISKEVIIEYAKENMDIEIIELIMALYQNPQKDLKNASLITIGHWTYIRNLQITNFQKLQL